MKPTIQFNSARSRPEASENGLRLSSLASRRHRRPLLRLSRGLPFVRSARIIQERSSPDFATEAAFFGVIVMTAAVSLISSVAAWFIWFVRSRYNPLP